MDKIKNFLMLLSKMGENGETGKWGENGDSALFFF